QRKTTMPTSRPRSRPAGSARSVGSLIPSTLRRALGAAAVRSGSAGLRVALDAHERDLAREVVAPDRHLIAGALAADRQLHVVGDVARLALPVVDDLAVDLHRHSGGGPLAPDAVPLAVHQVSSGAHADRPGLAAEEAVHRALGRIHLPV